MRICLYTNSALPKLGGQEAVVDALAREFLALGHQPVVLAPRPRLPLRPRDQRLPYPVLRHPRFLSTKVGVQLYRRWLIAAHRRHRFDVLHCHDVYPSGYLAALSQPQLGIPTLITSHGGDVRPGNVRLSKPGLRSRFVLAIQKAEVLISIGSFTTEGFVALGADDSRIVLIPNGVHADEFAQPVARPSQLNPRIQPASYLLFLGRLSPRKGVDLLLSALQLAGPTVHAVIAGSGAEEAAIQQRIEQQRLQTRVHLVGRVEGQAKTYLLQNALAVVMPSRGWEAFPLVVLESYAAGRPVIGTNIPGLADVVQHQQTGLLVPAESPSALAAAMRELVDDPPHADRMGHAARAIAQQHDWRHIAHRHLSLYQRLIDAAATTIGRTASSS